jgi:hypothetical protein
LVGFVCELLELSGGFDLFCSLYDFLVVCMIAYLSMQEAHASVCAVCPQPTGCTRERLLRLNPQ